MKCWYKIGKKIRKSRSGSYLNVIQYCEHTSLYNGTILLNLIVDEVVLTAEVGYFTFARREGRGDASLLKGIRNTSIGRLVASR
jgi:hypothetical protein